jgi:hypothetical protein
MKKDKMTIITNSGGLEITLNLNEVTWFRFLQASRATNSLRGGWNSRTHWLQVLNLLGGKDANYLEDWTQNSLDAKDPAPRQNRFLFNRDLSPARGRLQLGSLRKSVDLSKISENELNTRLFHDNAHGLWGANIGYEIPLSAESDGQLKVDIFAIGKDNCSLEIIELKKANNKSDSPLMALTEAICYGIQAVRCRDYLLKNSVLMEKLVSPRHFETIRLILAAPHPYWEYWKWDKGLIKPMENIIALVNKVLTEKKAALHFDKQSICRLNRALLPIEVV